MRHYSIVTLRLLLATLMSVATLWSATSMAFAQEKGDQGDAAVKERDRLQGTWIWLSVEVNGEKKADEGIKSREIATVIEGDKMKVTVKGKQTQEATFRLNPAKNPREIDLILKQGDTEYTLKGIYRIDGDTLKLCYGGPEMERPTEFVSVPGSTKVGVTVMQRKKP